MGLADTAKSLQENSISRELAWLRQLRKFTEENTNEKLIAEFNRIEAYGQTLEGKANPKKVWIMTTDILERGSLAEFYRRVLQYAEIKQKKNRNGGGEKAIRLHWDELQRMEKGIKKRYEKQREEIFFPAEKTTNPSSDPSLAQPDGYGCAQSKPQEAR